MTKIQLILRSRFGAFAATVVMLVCSSCTENATDVEPHASQSSEKAPVGDKVSASGNAEQGEPIREQIVTLSSQTADQLRSMRDKGKLKEQAMVRIRVVPGNAFRFKGGGEKRYRYSMLIDDELTDLSNFYVMESQNLTVIVDKDSGDFLRGTEVMWIESGGRSGFIFRNPNEVRDDEAPSAAGPIPVPANLPRTTPTPIEN